MECDVMSSLSSSPDMYFNNFLDVGESDDSESDKTEPLEAVELIQAKLTVSPLDSLEINGGSDCSSPRQNVFPSSPVKGDTNALSNSDEESNPAAVALHAELIDDADLIVEDDEALHLFEVELENGASSDQDEDSTHSQTRDFDSVLSFDSPTGLASIVDGDFFVDRISTSENTIMEATRKASSEDKAEQGDAVVHLSALLKPTNDDMKNETKFKLVHEGAIGINCRSTSPPDLKCTCAENGIRVSVEQECNTGLEDDDTEPPGCAGATCKDANQQDTPENRAAEAQDRSGNLATEAQPQLQDYMVGLVGGKIDETVDSRVIAYRKTERLAVRLPRIYHTRDSDSSVSDRSKQRQRNLKSKGLPRPPTVILSEFAKEKGYDINYVMENHEELGLAVEFPCMQCYDQHGRSSLVDTVMKSVYGYGKNQAGKHRCLKCGAEKMDMATFCKMLLKLKQTFKELGLIVRDVSSDGNCLFAAIVDQLRVKGDFRYTQENLRVAAVEYLRNNPTADDGTPYSLFLSGETWDQYLTKMSRDGEWGDHMVLSAISNLLNKKVIIFGGRTGEGTTEIVPKGYVNDYFNHQYGESEHSTYTDNHQQAMTTGLDEVDRVDGLESDKTEENTKGKEKEVPAYDESCLYLGHVGESHYVSIRRKDWRKRLEQGLKAQLLMQKNQPTLRKLEHDDTVMANDADTKMLDVTSLQPLHHLNLMVKQILQGGYIQSLNASLVERVESSQVLGMAVFSLEGDQINKLSPFVEPVESIFNTGSTVFADETTDHLKKGKAVKEKMFDATIFITTQDTEVVDSIDVGRKFDLVIDRICEAHDIVNLQPVTPSVWAGRTISLENDKTLLNSFPVSISFPLLSKYGQCILAFRSHWPDKAYAWQTRRRISGWPDSRTVEAVVSEGVRIVPMNLAKKPDVLDEPEYVKSVQDDKSLWLISFAEAEKEILRFLPESAKDCYMLFKLLVDSFLKEQGRLPGSCLKHLFFHACENLITERWKKEPGTCLMYLLQKLMLSLKTELPHYFVPQKNLLQSLSRRKIKEIEHQIELLSFQPLLGVFQFMDEHDLDITELGPLLDDLIEDVCRFNNHMSVSMSVEDSFVPALHCMLHDYVLQHEFENAKKVVNELLEQLELPDNDEYVASVITSSFSSQHVGYAWCLALYIELANKRKGITRVLCDNYKTVPISEVFGPEVVDELGDTIVPEIFSIPRGDLTFPEVVATVLEKSGNTKLLSKCLHYYIETYQDIFGTCPVNAAGGCRIPGCLCGFTKLLQLHDLYVRLYNSYYYTGRPTEFKDLVPKFTEVVERLRTPICSKNLINILIGVGETEKAMKLRRKLNATNAYSYDDTYDDTMSFNPFLPENL